MSRTQLEESLVVETHLGHTMAFELALLKCAPSPPDDEGSRRCMIIAALQEGAFNSWPENVQNQWFEYLQREFFGFQSES